MGQVVRGRTTQSPAGEEEFLLWGTRAFTGRVPSENEDPPGEEGSPGEPVHHIGQAEIFANLLKKKT